MNNKKDIKIKCHNQKCHLVEICRTRTILQLQVEATEARSSKCSARAKLKKKLSLSCYFLLFRFFLPFDFLKFNPLLMNENVG